MGCRGRSRWTFPGFWLIVGPSAVMVDGRPLRNCLSIAGWLLSPVESLVVWGSGPSSKPLLKQQSRYG